MAFTSLYFQLAVQFAHIKVTVIWFGDIGWRCTGAIPGPLFGYCSQQRSVLGIEPRAPVCEAYASTCCWPNKLFWHIISHQVMLKKSIYFLFHRYELTSLPL